MMKTNLITIAAMALALSPSLALASDPRQGTQSNGTGHANQYHDRTPHVHNRYPASHR
jgi:hypothetical protein